MAKERTESGREFVQVDDDRIIFSANWQAEGRRSINRTMVELGQGRKDYVDPSVPYSISKNEDIMLSKRLAKERDQKREKAIRLGKSYDNKIEGKTPRPHRRGKGKSKSVK